MPYLEGDRDMPTEELVPELHSKCSGSNQTSADSEQFDRHCRTKSVPAVPSEKAHPNIPLWVCPVNKAEQVEELAHW